jgi:hypothetical protein
MSILQTQEETKKPVKCFLDLVVLLVSKFFALLCCQFSNYPEKIYWWQRFLLVWNFAKMPKKGDIRVSL